VGQGVIKFKYEYQPVIRWMPNNYLSSDIWTRSSRALAERQGRLAIHVEQSSPKVSSIPEGAETWIVIERRRVITWTGKWGKA
jgi:hypothetical protein